jgi:site-specific recombinase XerD
MRLNEIVLLYVAFRKSMGEDFASAESLLKTFCRRMGENIELTDITAEHVQAFLAGTGTVSGYWRRKYDTLRGLYRYAISRGFIDHAPLPRTAVRAPRFKPYIYTDAELRRLLKGITACLNPPRKLEPHTLRAILLVLYGAGLRVGEVVALTVADVDVPGSVITIRDTKFHKTRVVPLGPQLNQVIADYAKCRETAGHSTHAEAPFFVLRRGAPTSVQIIEYAFRRLRRHAGVRRNDGARYQPRLHDIRHCFAVKRLTAWYREGADVQKLLPQLATYLGHVKLSATQVYLTMTPELLREASMRFEQYACREARHG